jgi:hypothetical protein
MRIFLILCIVLNFINLAKCDRKLQVFNNGSRFRSIECSADNYTSVVKFCYVKAISRRTATITAHLATIRTSYKPIYVQLVLFYRYGNIYREVIDTKLIEWCSIMEGMRSHLFLVQILDQIRAFAGDNMHKCPYSHDLVVTNLTLDDTKPLDLFPEGIYKFSWITRNSTMNIMWRFNVTLQVKSSLKESMG